MRFEGSGISITMQFESDELVVRVASNGVAGSEGFRKQAPNVRVSGMKLRRLHGKDLCRAFKSPATLVPVVVLSASAEVEDEVLLLELTAGDYLKRPFSPEELLVRVRGAIGQTDPPPRHVTAVAPETVEHELLTFGDVRIDFTGMEGARGGKVLTLTAQQFKLLKFFARSPGRVFSRDELLNEVWGYEDYPTTRTIDNHILRLRQKLEPDPANPRYFLTMHGAGYKFTTGNVATAGQTNALPVAKKTGTGELVKASALSRGRLLETRVGRSRPRRKNHELPASFVGKI